MDAAADKKERARIRYQRYRVRHGLRAKTLLEKFEARHEKIPEAGCWIWTGNIVGTRPYGRIKINGKLTPAHRVSWEIHNGPIPDGLLALHQCDVGVCVNPNHLFLGDQAANMHDMKVKGRARCADHHGTAQSTAKLTDELVRMIRKSTMGTRPLARELGINKGTVNRIRRGLRWSHVV